MSKNITYVFIDAQNLYLGIKNSGWKLDYLKLNIYLKDKYEAKRVFIYMGYINSYRNLYNYLKRVGFDIVFKEIIDKNKKRDIKGNIDVCLTVDSIKKSQYYSRAVFISADGDFVPLYDYLTNDKNKDLIILIPNMQKYSKLLLKYKSKLRFMNDLRDKIGE